MRAADTPRRPDPNPTMQICLAPTRFGTIPPRSSTGQPARNREHAGVKGCVQPPGSKCSPPCAVATQSAVPATDGAAMPAGTRGRRGRGWTEPHCTGRNRPNLICLDPGPVESAEDGQPSPKTGWFDDEIASLYSRSASEPQQSGDDVRGDLAQWRRPTGRPLNAAATAFGQVLDRLLDHRTRPTAFRSAWLSRRPGDRSGVTWVRP
jgi:hypothetical protein